VCEFWHGTGLLHECSPVASGEGIIGTHRHRFREPHATKCSILLGRQFPIEGRRVGSEHKRSRKVTKSSTITHDPVPLEKRILGK
jgi:hypothetical protein